MPKRTVVELTDDPKGALVRREDGPLTRRQRNRVQIVLRTDSGETDESIADGLRVRIGIVANVRRRFTPGGLDAAPDEKPRPEAKPSFGSNMRIFNSIMYDVSCHGHR